MKLIASTFAFVKELDGLSYELATLDRVWDVLFPDQAKKWHHLHVNKYKHTFYITHVGSGGGLEVEPEKGARSMDWPDSSSCRTEDHGQLDTAWEPLIKSARKWLEMVRKDWVKANRRIQVEYPLRHRYGIIPSYASLHRANQHFSQDEDVFDVMYYDDLGRFKHRITPFVTWEPLPILKPRDI